MRTTKRHIAKRVIFWLILFLAPVAFFSMVLFYLNSYFTSDRLIFFSNPLIEAVTDSKTHIENANINLGLKSTITLIDITLSSKPDNGEQTDLIETTHIEDIVVHFQLLSLFFGSLKVDSIIISGISGVLPFERFHPLSDMTWTDKTGARTVTVNMGFSDLKDMKINSFTIRNSSFTYRNPDYSLFYHIDTYTQDLRIDVSTLVNIVLINGYVSGTLVDLSDDAPPCAITLYGRMQINIDDKSILIREGTLTVNEIKLPFTALMKTIDEQTRWRIFFERSREDISVGLEYLPPSVQHILISDNEESKLYFDLLYSEENDSI